MQRLPNPCVPATCLGSFSRDQEKIQDLHQDRCCLQREQPADFVDTDHVLLCGLEQVQEILVYLIQNSTWDLAVSCGVGPFPSPISLLLSVQMLDNAGFCCPHWVTCHCWFLLPSNLQAFLPISLPFPTNTLNVTLFQSWCWEEGNGDSVSVKNAQDQLQNIRAQNRPLELPVKTVTMVILGVIKV